MSKIRSGMYTHLIISPEQAVNLTFRGVIRNSLRDKIGLITINELYFVATQKEFRPNFQYLKDIRTCLQANTPLFGCTITLDVKIEVIVKEFAGFRLDGPYPFQTEVIRTTVDRLEIQLVIKRLKCSELKGKRLIYAVLLNVKRDDSTFDIQSILKTIIFINSKTSISNQLQLARDALIALSAKTSTLITLEAVRHVIDFYTRETLEYD